MTLAARTVPQPSPAALARARRVVAEALPPTPLVAAAGLGEGALLKLECAQPTGAFKVRGALAAMAAMPPDDEVVTASAGNHALGVAWAARRLGRQATVVVPESASPAKLAALQAGGCAVERVGRSYDAAEDFALAMAAPGRRYLSAYNDPDVIAGQATIGAELEGLDGPITVVVHTGGGGLLAGIALWAEQRPAVRVVGVESAASRALSTAVTTGVVAPAPIAATIADGLAGNLESSAITPAIVRGRVEDIAAVTEPELRAAIRFLAREHGIIAEGAGAAAVAALLAGRVAVAGRPVALVTGRNIALAALSEVLADAAAQ